MIYRLFVIFCCIQFVASLHCDKAIAVDFETQIRPLLKERCVPCHGASKQSGGLRLDAKTFAFRGGDSGAAIVVNQSSDSEIVRRIESLDASERMPPESDPLDSMQRELIKKWVDGGADWTETDEDHAASVDSRRDHWAWQPIQVVPPPTTLVTTSTNSIIRNDIDRFLIVKLSELGLGFSPEADRRTLIRRLYFDLLGLPPTPEQVRAFEQDEDEHAYENLVERILRSPHYGERAAQHWLDIAHYADTHGFERDQIREHAWRYRDWVIQALNADLPYDQFLRQQIAGDAINADSPESVIATGFLSAGPWDFVGQAETPSPVLRRLARADDLDDMVTQVMTATTAITINCARCHDHKLDPISQREYYSLCSIFAGSKRGNRFVNAAAEKQLSETKTRLSLEIQDLKKQIQKLNAKGWDLADIVGGGNGLGTGVAMAGIDPASGIAIKDPRGYLENAPPNLFRESPRTIVDGVSIPNGQNIEDVVVTSTGITIKELPATSGKAWDAIRNGPVHSQFSSRLGDIDYKDGYHTLLGLHANSLITFDLNELPPIGSEALSQKQDAVLRGSVGYFGETPKEGASVLVLLDGKVFYKRLAFGRDDGMQSIDLAIPQSSRFLTLIATDNGNGIGHDQVCFADLRIEPQMAVAPTEASNHLENVAILKEQLSTITKQLASIGESEQVYGVLSEVPPKVTILARGDTEQPREEVLPSAIDCLVGLKNFSLQESASDSDRRLQLANWITDRQNPLTSRVIVNRLWQQHFGVGIVSTPSDFGHGGSLPSNPELLDWLASKLQKESFSLKAMHRLICCSAAYRQHSILLEDSELHAKGLKVDASNRYLWRQSPRRLDAESLRDAILAVSGQLEPRMYGPGFREFDYKEEYAPVYSYVTKDDRDLFRRTIYRFRVRTTPNPFLTTLDCPNSANLTPTRNNTTTALQSLAMLNHDFLLQQSEYFAKRLEQTDPDQAVQVSRAWELVFGRQPLENERQAAIELISKRGLPTFCRYLLNANEFVSVD